MGGSGTPQAGVTRGPKRLAAGPRAHASPDPLLAVGGHRAPPGAGSDARPARSGAAAADGAAHLRPLPAGTDPREPHRAEEMGTHLGAGPRLGADLRRLSAPLGASVSPLVGGRCAQHRPLRPPGVPMQRGPAVTHPGAGAGGVGSAGTA